MCNENIVEQLKEETKQTLALGRTEIIRMAAAVITEDEESILHDKYVFISVWYNDTKVKVHFKEYAPLKFISSTEPSYHDDVEVFVSLKRGIYWGGGHYVPECADNGSSLHFGKANLYRTSRDREIAIEKVIALNNNHNEHKLSKDFTYLVIKERETYYCVQIDKEYPITYKINKKTGKIFDYEDPYRYLRIVPEPPPEDILPQGEAWKELKE